MPRASYDGIRPGNAGRVRLGVTLTHYSGEVFHPIYFGDIFAATNYADLIFVFLEVQKME
jgi:hypothetical protein